MYPGPLETSRFLRIQNQIHNSARHNFSDVLWIANVTGEVNFWHVAPARDRDKTPIKSTKSYIGAKSASKKNSQIDTTFYLHYKALCCAGLPTVMVFALKKK
jgi:hypothetical protein